MSLSKRRKRFGLLATIVAIAGLGMLFYPIAPNYPHRLGYDAIAFTLMLGGLFFGIFILSVTDEPSQYHP